MLLTARYRISRPCVNYYCFIVSMNTMCLKCFGMNAIVNVIILLIVCESVHQSSFESVRIFFFANLRDRECEMKKAHAASNYQRRTREVCREVGNVKICKQRKENNLLFPHQQEDENSR